MAIDTSLTSPKKASFGFRLPQLRNPILSVEMRSRMRGKRSFIIMFIFLAVILLAIIAAYLFYWNIIQGNAYDYYSSYYSSYQTLTQKYNEISVSARQTFGKVIYWVMLALEFFFVSILAPALTATGFTSEREHQTYDLLKITMLKPRALVYGKFLSGFIFVLVVLLAILPIQSLAFLFGGISLSSILTDLMVIIAMAASVCALGIFLSTLFKRSIPSVIFTYAISMIWAIIIPLFSFVISNYASYMLYDVLYNQNGNITPYIDLIVLGLWFVRSINPISAIVSSYSSGSSILDYLYGTSTVYTAVGSSANLPPSWIIFALFSALFCLIMLVLSMLRLRIIEN